MKIQLIAVAFLVVVLGACKKDKEETTTTNTTAQSGTVKIEMEHLFATDDFVLNTAYTTSASETLNFTKVRYYLTNVQFTKSDGTVWSEPSSSHLIDLSVDEGNLFSIPNVPKGTYTAITFTIGVENDAAFDGPFLWLEGTSAQATAGTFTYHIGGSTGANASQRSGTFAFAPYTLDVSASGSPQIHLTVNLKNVWDNATTPLSVATLSTVEPATESSATAATNFFESIEFEHIHN